jgi:hypothetical protein
MADTMATRPPHDHDDEIAVALADAHHLAQRITGSRDAWLTSLFGPEAASVQKETAAALIAYLNRPNRIGRVASFLLMVLGAVIGILCMRALS